MPHLPIIAAMFLTGQDPGATDPAAWFSLGEIERIVYAFSSLRDDSNEDFDSGQAQPGDDALGQFWAGGAEGEATLGPDAHAVTDAIQLSGPANNGAFWSLGDVDLSMTASAPLIQAFTGGGSRLAFTLEVNEPTRLESFIQLTSAGGADTLAWARLRAAGSGPWIYNFQITEGEVLVEEPLTLPAGDYTLEAGARAEVFDVLGLTITGASFTVSFTPTASCNAADIAAPYGALDFGDIAAFLTAFSEQRTDADLGWPPTAYDMSDLIEFLTIFYAGCP